ncbi:hypothetical protein M2447_000923 [Ereboglobus sp. PH5-10]|uniref:hypothetical protein n=1 Tax=Ereboglobus sp. PH5-10 TaxID=2940629 RepID=UPI002404EE34|nr:hypothetical protein [Ereboglobus sp. PH5-10]MDF9826838.1 hypothetical protein [Ereboglobus sp. PH5-10]
MALLVINKIMRTHVLSLFLLLLAGCSSQPTIIELPCPNSGTYSFSEAEAKKSDILSLTLSPPLKSWRREAFFGFGIHIDRADQIFVYSPSLPPEIFAFPLDRPISVTELKELINRYKSFLDSRPASLLITSEIDPKRSAVFMKVVDWAFQPSIQIYYRKERG